MEQPYAGNPGCACVHARGSIGKGNSAQRKHRHRYGLAAGFAQPRKAGTGQNLFPVNELAENRGPQRKRCSAIARCLHLGKRVAAYRDVAKTISGLTNGLR